MTKQIQRPISLLLALIMILAILPFSADASSIQDGSQTATVSTAGRQHYLTTTVGTRLGASAYTYTTNDGLSGPAFCIDHGLNNTTSSLPITGKYNSSPATAGAFANGYPQHSVDIFLGLYLETNPILSGLTDDEFAYATQIAVWATLGQLAVDGTSFSSGRETVSQPIGDTQQARVFRAVQLILAAAEGWDMVYQAGMYIRTDENALGGNLSFPANMTLEYAANENVHELKQEVINGVSYYTREYIFASATSTYYSDYNIELWATGAPMGTIFVDTNNQELARGTFRETATWSLPTEYKETTLNSNGFEYSHTAKLCIPVDTAPNSGEITINSGAHVMQYEIYLAHNEVNYEQSYIISDPSKGTQTANAVLTWGGELTETGRLQITKVNGSGAVLEGAEFELTGTDGTRRVGTSDSDGKILWENLKPDITYTLTETKAPAGYAIVDPINVQIEAARTNYVTVKNDTQKQLTVRKIDGQNGYSLAGAVIRFEQIDGSFTTDKTTDHAGMISMSADELPIGSYKVYEVSAPNGYEVDSTPQTVDWNGKNDITLTFENIRKPTLIIYKCDEGNNYNLPGATFEVYKNGQLVTTVTTDDNGLAYVPDVSTGYYTVKETVAPEGYLLNEKEYSVYIDTYDPATTEDPRLVISNKAKPKLLIQKYDAATNKPLADCTFEVYKDAALIGTYTTDADGQIVLTDIMPGTYFVKEVATADGYVVDSTPQEIEVLAGVGIVQMVFFNTAKPGVHILKVDSETNEPLQGAVFRIELIGGSFKQEYTTDANGEIDLTGLNPGTYSVTEVSAPSGYIIDNSTRIINLNAGENAMFVFSNTAKPDLTIKKIDSITGDAIEGARFHIIYASNNTFTGELNDLGYYYSDENGEIILSDANDGWYRVEEVEPATGYAIKDTGVQEFYLSAGEGKTVTFENIPLSALVIKKVDADTGEGLQGAKFSVRYLGGTSGTGGTVIGEYTSSANGTIVITGLEAGTYIVEEMKAPDGYEIDDTPKTVYLSGKDQDVVTVEFSNSRHGKLIVRKIDSITKQPLSGAEFKITYSDGSFVGNYGGTVTSNGIYTTDENGQIHIVGIKPGSTLVVTETKAPDGYVLDTTSQTVQVNQNDIQTLTFENTPIGGLIIIKEDFDDGDRIEGARFEVREANGKLIGNYTTDKNGTIVLNELSEGWYIITEIRAADGYLLDDAEHRIEVKNGETVTLEITNKKESSILIHKTDSETGKGIYGVTFVIYDNDKNPIDQVTTDQKGYAYVDGELTAGKYYIRELEAAEGYIADEGYKTVYVKSGKTTTVEWENTPITGQIQITKYAEVDNSVTGDVAGTKLKGAVFEVVHYKSGAVVDYITTDTRGVAATEPLPLGRYIITEVTAPHYYQLSGDSFDVEIEFEGQIVRLAAYNKPAELGVSITKTGISEVLAGSTMFYRFTVANTSNVPLENFFWHDRIPTDATTAVSLSTGTYSHRLSYSVLYKTNFNDYRTLASNLLTTNHYSFALNAIPLMTGEVVTDIYFDFGTVPSGFQSMESPMLSVAVSPMIADGYHIINRVDVGGKYQGTWETGITSWLTITRRLIPIIPLPRTGY